MIFFNIQLFLMTTLCKNITLIRLLTLRHFGATRLHSSGFHGSALTCSLRTCTMDVHERTCEIYEPSHHVQTSKVRHAAQPTQRWRGDHQGPRAKAQITSHHCKTHRISQRNSNLPKLKPEQQDTVTNSLIFSFWLD